MRILILDTIDKDGKDNNGHGRIIKYIISSINPKAEILTYKVCDAGGQTVSSKLAEGLVYAMNKDIDIINMSLGLNFITPGIMGMIDYLTDNGVTICASAGNGYSSYPGLYDKVISVGSCDAEGNRCSYSSDIYDVLEIGSINVEGKYYEGTSFACARYVGKLSRGDNNG